MGHPLFFFTLSFLCFSLVFFLTKTQVSSIVDSTLEFDTTLAMDGKWPAIDISTMTSVPTLASQPKPLTELSRGLCVFLLFFFASVEKPHTHGYLSYIYIYCILRSSFVTFFFIYIYRYHMQVAARETQKSSDLMGSFGLNLYDEGRVEEGRRMKYWSKMEELLLTGSARQRRR